MDGTHTNYVKIHYSGKDYIGQIKSIDSVWNVARTLGDINLHPYLERYIVCIYEKDTFCEIGNIIIYDISEIQPYEDVSNG